MCTVFDFTRWLEVNEDDLQIEWAESGADREADADWDRWVEIKYDEYVRSHGWTS